MAIDAKVFQTGWSGLGANDIASFLGKTLTTEEESVVNSLISSVERFICSQCNRQFKDGVVYEEILDAGKGRYDLFNYPINEITSIYLDGNVKYDKNSSDNDWELNDDFFVYDDYVIFDSDVDTNSAVDNHRALKIEYSIKKFWGDDVLLAIKRFVGELFSQREFGGKVVNSFSVGGNTISFNASEIPEYLQVIIRTYKKIVI